MSTTTSTPLFDGTPQGLFDVVTRHLFAQGRGALQMMSDGHKRCAYRGEDGTKCAIGAVIPDADYDPTFEGQSTYNHRVREVANLNDEVHPLARALQDAHDKQALARPDGVFERPTLATRLRQIGRQFFLNTDAIPET